MCGDSSQPTPIAQWNPMTCLWETEELSLFSERQEPYSETWPTSGMTRNGSLLPLPASAPHIGESACSSLLPTPSACNPNDGEGTETWLARREVVKARVGNGNGMGMPLSIAVQLLPTPNASDCTGGGQHPDKREGHSQQLIDEVLAPEQWGKYTVAIRRWEALTRPAPSPTEPNKNGNPRLSAAFSEWLLGWPAGWVTDPAIGISRNDQLRIVGNGVVPAQAYAALTYLLSIATQQEGETV